MIAPLFTRFLQLAHMRRRVLVDNSRMRKSFLLLALVTAITLVAGCTQATPAPDASVPTETAAVADTAAPTQVSTVTAESPTPTDIPPSPTASPTPITIDVSSLPAAPGTEFNPEGFNDRAGRGFVSLDDPAMITSDLATWLEPGHLVLGVIRNGEAHAFPVIQMAYHHIANVTIGGQPFLVTY